MNPWLQQLAQRFHRGRGGAHGGGGMGMGPWGNPGSHNGGQGPQPRTMPVPWAQPGGMAGIQAGGDADGGGGPERGVATGGGDAPAQLPNGWLQRLSPGGTAAPGQQLPTEQIKPQNMLQRPMPQFQMPQFQGWQQNSPADPRVANIQAQGQQRAMTPPEIPQNEDEVTGMPRGQYDQYRQQRGGY